MNKIIKRLSIFLLALTLVSSMTITAPVEAQASVKTVNIAKKKVTMTAGTKIQVKAKFGNKTITTNGKWSSNNKKTAIVNKKGIVTARSKGQAKVTVKYKKKAKTILVIVKPKAVTKTKQAPASNVTAQTPKTVSDPVISDNTNKSNTCDHIYNTEIRATCITDGLEKCSICRDTRIIPMKHPEGHNWELEEEPTCGHNGYYYCWTCGEKQIIKSKYPSKHNYIVSEEPTCLTYGHEECTYCHDTRLLNRLDHNLVNYTVREWINGGDSHAYESEWYTCQNCNAEFETLEEITAHVKDTNSTCFQATVQKGTCTKTYPKTAHGESHYGTCDMCKEDICQDMVIYTEDITYRDPDYCTYEIITIQ